MTNFYTIQTIEFHKEALAFVKECAAKRTEDVGLSVWADSAIIHFHEFAIEALSNANYAGVTYVLQEAPRAVVHNDDCDRYGGAENY